MNESGLLEADPDAIAEELNAYFSSVFTREDMQYMPAVADPDTHLNMSLDNILINDKIVMDKLNKLRSDKATGASDISPKLLTRIKDEVCLPLTIIFQKSLETGQVSCDWKTADVTPIYKKGSRSQPSNYIGQSV